MFAYCLRFAKAVVLGCKEEGRAMKRLNEQELRTRINKFLGRKEEEFPDLSQQL
jgi:hypothetical protein